jgi:hypothetical protein
MKKSLLCMLLLAAWASAQSPVATQTDLQALQLRKEQLKAELNRLDQDLRRTDSLSQWESNWFQQQKTRQEQAIAGRKAELQNLQQRLAAVRAESQKERLRESSAKVQVESFASRLKFFNQELERQARVLEGQIQNSLPWQQESRLDRVRALIRELQAGTASPEEGLGRLRALWDEEIRFGDEVVLTETSMTRLNGALVNVKLLRLGNVGMAYTDAEGKYYGILRSEQSGNASKKVWFEDLNFEQREMVRRAIEIKSGKMAPDLGKLPWWGLALKSESVPASAAPSKETR